MADNSIMFKIGSIFNGEGFKKAQNAVKQTNGEIKKGIGVANQLGGAFGSLSTSASKSMGAIQGLLSAVTTLNPALIIGTATIAAVNYAVDKLKSRVDELNERAKKAGEAIKAAFDKNLTSSVKEINDEIAAIGAGFDNVAKRALAMTAAFEGMRSATAEGGLIDLEVEKVNKMLLAQSDAMRAEIEAEYALKIATEKEANTRMDGEAKLKAAAEAVRVADERVVIAAQKLEKISAERANLEEIATVAKNSADQNYVKIEAEVAKLAAEEQKLKEQLMDAETAAAVALDNETTVSLKVANANKSAEIAVTQAVIAQNKLRDAVEARKLKEEEAREAAARKAADDLEAARIAQEQKVAAEEKSKLEKEASTLHSQLNESTAKLKKAEDELAAAIKNYRANWASNKLYEKAFNGGIGLNERPGLAEMMSQATIEDAVKSGKVRTVRGLERLTYETNRANRNRISEEAGQLNREQARYDRLTNADGSRRNGLSKSDTDFLNKYEQLKAQAEAAQREIDQAQYNVESAAAQRQQDSDNIQAIRDKLDELGLK